MGNQDLIPAIKAKSKATHHPYYAIPCNSFVVRIDDLLTTSGRNFTKEYNDIKKAGGIRNHYKNPCSSILSTVMTNRKISECPKEKYLDIINAMCPELIFTPDGETYYDDIRRSQYVMETSLACIDFLIDNGIAPGKMIGLILGANFEQIGWYVSELLKRNISKFCLHVSDFRFRKGNFSKKLALEYARYVRPKVPYLMIYGGGTRKFFELYHFADAFVTESHFVAGYYHKKICHIGQKKYNGKIYEEFIMSNLYEIYHYHLRRDDHQSLPSLIEIPASEKEKRLASLPNGGK